MQCTPEQIEQKRKLAQQKLAQKFQTRSPIKTCAPIANPTTPTLLNASTSSYKSPKQFTFKPYEKKPSAKPSTTQQFYGNTKTITGTCSLVSDDRFAVDLSGYSAQAIAAFKTIPTRFYSKYILFVCEEVFGAHKLCFCG